MNQLLQALAPEIGLCVVACVLFLMGTSNKPGVRKASAIIALLSLLGTFAYLFFTHRSGEVQYDESKTVLVGGLAIYIKGLAAGLGCVFVLLAWPNYKEGTGSASIDYGQETSEFFALLLLSIAGLFTVASANDLILLFLGIELASIPTYIMVSMSRPLPVAQEAGVKYFFLGAMSAAIMLFGFSYLYGTTGTVNLTEISNQLAVRHEGISIQPTLTNWQLLAAMMLLAGFAFKMAAVPLHVYAGDVYQGAATPVTAFLAFVPKASGFVALLKIMHVLGGGSWAVPSILGKTLWAIAVLTMCAGNMLALLQQVNVKRVLAYSSVAHTGYMLVGLATIARSPIDSQSQLDALSAVLFYLAAYGIMNAGAFGVLMMIPSRDGKPATTAETFEDLAGVGRNRVGLGLAMAVSCFSLTGLPLTVGFFSKFLLIKPALAANQNWLVVIMMINAAVSAVYYLKIVAAMFLRPAPEGAAELPPPRSAAVGAAVLLSVTATLLLGIALPMTQTLMVSASTATLSPGLNLPAEAATKIVDAR